MKNDSLLNWKDIRSRLEGKTNKELIALLSGCYRLGKENKEYLTASVLETAQEKDAMLQALKEEMRSLFFGTDRYGAPHGPNLREAKKVVTKAKNISDDPADAIAFMLEYVECGIKFTNMYGDMWEAYYSSMERMLSTATETILRHKGSLDVHDYQKRIKAIVDDTCHIGWGFQPELECIYEEYVSSLSLEDDGL